MDTLRGTVTARNARSMELPLCCITILVVVAAAVVAILVVVVVVVVAVEAESVL